MVAKYYNIHFKPSANIELAPVAETGFSHRLTAYKIEGHLFGKLFFLESVAFQFHACMLNAEVAQSLKSYGYFSDLGVGIRTTRQTLNMLYLLVSILLNTVS